jgi:hypothetical protein
MANPIALAMIALGLFLLVLGIGLLARRSRVAGMVCLVLGLAVAAVPLVSTAILAR